MSVKETNCTIHWTVIYLVDSIIHRLANWDQVYGPVLQRVYNFAWVYLSDFVTSNKLWCVLGLILWKVMSPTLEPMSTSSKNDVSLIENAGAFM